MAQQPRGKPPSQAPPPAGRGRNALTALGGGVLVLAVAGGAWALFGRDSNKSSTTAIGPKVPTSAPANPVFGPVVPGTAVKPATATVKPTSLGPVAASAVTQPAATTSPKPAPTKAAVKTKPTPVATTAAPKPAPTASKPPVSTPPVVTPPVTGPQQVGTVAKKAYTFKVARGDTLWGLAKQTLRRTGRSTSNANVVAFVQRFYAHNHGVVGSDPDLIVIGQALVWPAGL